MKKIILMLAGFTLGTPVLAQDTAPETAKPQEPATASAAPEQTLATGTVARATFTKDVAEREPVDAIDKLTADNSKVYYFTELRDMAGQTVTHRWEYNGKVMAEVPFTVNGSRWRVFSSKNLHDSWLGEWKVSVIDQAGGTLAVNTFSYEKPAADPVNAEAASQPTKTITDGASNGQ